MAKFQTGMSRDDVVKILGRPDSAKLEGSEETYSYNNRMISGWSWDRADYVFRFKDGSLVEYGPKNIVHVKAPAYDPQKDPNMLQTQKSLDKDNEMMKAVIAGPWPTLSGDESRQHHQGTRTGRSKVADNGQTWYEYRVAEGLYYWDTR